MTNKTLAIGTRLHLGNASKAPELEDLRQKVSSFRNIMRQACNCTSTYDSVIAAIAVDASDKIPNFNFVKAISDILDDMKTGDGGVDEHETLIIEILPISPWGNFIPALNNLVAWSSQQGADHVLFVSAEMKLPDRTVGHLEAYLNDADTLVVGAALPGHEFHQASNQAIVEVDLGGCTTPWNTLALWNVSKLALTGFPMVGEGVHRSEDNNKECIAGGVEEVSAIALLQKILPTSAGAKLTKVPGIIWENEFADEERRKWHESKMKSKRSRPAKHLDLLNLNGTVHHIS